MLSWLTKRSEDPKQALRRHLGDYALPTFPAVVLAALAKLRDARTSSTAIADEIAADPGISARLLQMANSPAFALRRPVRNVDHAISLLGRSEVECLLLAVAVQKQVKHTSKSDGVTFWQAAARRATVARSLAAELHPATASESFTAALLQDMAVPVLTQVKGAAYRQLLGQWRADGGDLANLERSAFGVDHAEVAQLMSETWRFPERLIDAIGGHHGLQSMPPNSAPNSGSRSADDFSAVNLVSLLGDEEGVGLPELLELAHASSGIPLERLENVVRDASARASELANKLAT